MQVLLFGRRPRLEWWEGRKDQPGTEGGPDARCKRDAYEREVGREPPGEPVAEGPHRRAAAAILRYEVFPPTTIEPVLRRAPLEAGDVIGARYRLLPGVALFFASRATERFDERAGAIWRTGFTYRTLAGHPEHGEETFSVEKDLASGRVIVALRAWSRPGSLLGRLFAPIARRLQVAGSTAALDHLEGIARGM